MHPGIAGALIVWGAILEANRRKGNSPNCGSRTKVTQMTRFTGGVPTITVKNVAVYTFVYVCASGFVTVSRTLKPAESNSVRGNGLRSP
jgi:hypothetical protein